MENFSWISYKKHMYNYFRDHSNDIECDFNPEIGRDVDISITCTLYLELGDARSIEIKYLPEYVDSDDIIISLVKSSPFGGDSIMLFLELSHPVELENLWNLRNLWMLEGLEYEDMEKIIKNTI